MQNVSEIWGAIFNAPHRVEYRFDIAGTAYYRDEINGTPVILKPLMDKPAIGRCCTGSLKLSIYPKSGSIPKAATVNAYCRLRSTIIGEGLSYQWQYQTVGSTSWTNSGQPGASTDTLSIQATTARNGQKYRCKITGSNGEYVYSNVAAIYTSAPSSEQTNDPAPVNNNGPVILTQPTDYVGNVGSTAVFKVVAVAASEWKQQGEYYITTRTGKNIVNINCLDRMITAGVTYRDKSSITEWPASMTDVVSDICEVMGVSLDERSSIKTGADYYVSYPNDDVLISEVLGMIAAAHGGNWIMTESGTLRLVVLCAPSSTADQTVGKTHKGFSARGKTQLISRVKLTDNANNEFVAGDDTGITISVRCNYATQGIANDLCSATASSVLYGVQYEPYSVDTAYLNPAAELGDTISFTDGDGTVHKVVAFCINMSCTMAGTYNLSALIDDETEDEYPYLSPRDLALERTVRTDQTYFGNSLTRKNGFVSELLVNGDTESRMIANASIFAMQVADGNGGWENRIYFDAQSGKYVINGDVTIQGLVSFINSLAESGGTVINGDNIITGQIKSNNGTGFFIDINAGTITVGSEDVGTALRQNAEAISSEVTRAEIAEEELSSRITQTAQELNVAFTEAFKGGINYIHNSSGLNGVSDDWETTGTVVALQNNDTKNYTVSNSCFRLSEDAVLSQSINTVLLGQPYTVSCKVRKTDYLLSEISVIYNGDSVGVLFSSSEPTDGWQDCKFTIDAIALSTLQIEATTESDYLYISDVMVCEGVTAKSWTPAPDEIYTSGVSIDKNGITVYRTGVEEKTVISNTEFAGYYRDEEIFSLNRDETRIGKAIVRGELNIDGTMFIPYDANSEKGINIAIID